MVGKRIAITLIALLALGIGLWAAVKLVERQVVGRYRPAKMVPVTPAEPAEDFARLRAMVRQHGGELVTTDDAVVRYKDTKWFRLFELTHHSVVVFPYNWAEHRFEIIMFAGHVRSYDNLFRAIEWGTLDRDTRTYRDIPVDVDVMEPSVREVGFHGFFLGTSREEAIRSHTEHLRLHDRHQLALDIENLEVIPGSSCGQKAGVRFSLYYQDGQLAYMHHIVSGMPSVFERSLTGPVLPVIAEGEFEIPRE